MKKLINFLCLLLVSNVALAQSFPRPPDVPAYVEQFNGYASGTTPNTIGDGSTAWGGTPPYYASMPADPNTASASSWISSSAVSYCNNGIAGDGSHGCTSGQVGGEAKFRTTINVTHVGYNDPIRNYGQPGVSHCHEFFGNKSTNAFSTYSTLRNRPASFSGGGVINGTGYWMPCPVKTNPFADGKNYAIKASVVLVYYTANPYTLSSRLTRIPRGLRYVTGVNMEDPDDLGAKAEVAAANAQTGTTGRYSYRGGTFRGWHCYSGTTGNEIGTIQPYLKNADNSDPWAGACVSGSFLVAQLEAAECWDGTNPWSPGGYKHLRQSVNDAVTGSEACPKNWYYLPALVVRPQFATTGFSDYGSWRLSSDDPAATAAGHSIPNGGSFHTDWFGGWRDTEFLTWQQFCLGVNGNTSHQCDYSTISATQRLLTDSPAPDGSRNPQVDTVTTFPSSSAANMFLLPSTTYTGSRAHATH